VAGNPVKTQRRLVCENSRFFVYLDDWRDQNKHARDYLVVAPKVASAQFVTGVGVLPVCDEKVGLLRVFRHAIETECWEIPRGFVEPDESEITSALRELHEETGLSCDASETESLGFVAPDPGILAARVHLFAARRCERVEAYTPKEFGHQEFRWFSRQEIDALIARSEIQDPCTLTAYFKYFNR